MNLKVNIEIKSEYSSAGLAKSVAKSLETDNVKLNNLSIRTSNSGSNVVSKIVTSNLVTAFSTIDDLIKNQTIAEEAVNIPVKRKTVKRKNK